MKVYCGRNSRGAWKASLDEKKLDNFDDVFESYIKAIHGNKTYMIQFCFGCDCDRGGCFDAIRYVRRVFYSVSEAKKHKEWVKREQMAKGNPQKFHITPFSIESNDFGDPFISSYLRSKQFSIEIIRVSVI